MASHCYSCGNYQNVGGAGLVESYIVRVYRRDEEDPARIAGVVEIVQTGKMRGFSDRDGLCNVVCQKSKNKRRNTKKRAGAGNSNR